MLIPMDSDEIIAELRKVRRLRERADAAQKAATEATDPAIVAALRAGLRPVDIVKESGVSDSYVRSVRRANNIAPNPSYANLTPPRRAKAGIPPDERYVKAAKVRRSREVADTVAAVREPEPAPESVARSRKPKLSSRVARLDPMQAARVAALAESHADGGWAARVIADYPGIGANWHPYVVVEAGLHRGFIEDTDLPD